MKRAGSTKTLVKTLLNASLEKPATTAFADAIWKMKHNIHYQTTADAQKLRRIDSSVTRLDGPLNGPAL